MTGFVIRRVAQSLLTVVIVTVMFFFAFRLIPYNFGQTVEGPDATPRQRAAFAHETPLGQYLHVMNSWLHGNFGYEPVYGRTVARILLDALPATAVLVLSALILTLLVGVPLGAVQGFRRYSILDRVCGALAVVANATPVMFTTFVFVDWFSVRLNLFPPIGPSSTHLGDVLGEYRAMVLPVVVLALPQIGRCSQLMRSFVLDQLACDYIRTARANGVGPARLVVRHLLRNVLAQVLTYLGLALPALLSSTLIVESAFNLEGLGYFLRQAADPKHLYFDIEFAVLFVLAIAIVFAQALVDIVVYFVDPRITR